MIALRGYEFRSQLQGAGSALVLRGRRLADGLPVVAKVLPLAFPGPEDLARFRREFAVTRDLGDCGVPRALELVESGERCAILLEDVGGESLALHMERRRPDLFTSLEIARAVADALHRIHARGYVHRDLNPNNVLWNPATRVVQVADLGLATTLPREGAPLEPPPHPLGTLPYLSPEQTGRTHRGVDARSDLYSLGATLYELLAGRPPFLAASPLGWVHAHLARVPRAPHETEPGVPEAVSAVVLRLLAKAPEDRYQSASGLRADLDRCLVALRETGTVPPFPLGGGDVSDRFRIPERLYGRAPESAALRAAVERSGHGPVELVLVSGEPGMGKSALVAQLQGPVLERLGLFGAGRFEQLRGDRPYEGMIQAVRRVLRQALAGEAADVEALSVRLREALGEAGGALAAPIPELSSLLGPLPAAPELPALQSQQRFHHVFGRLLRALATAERPVVLLLDDLQWADPSTLDLLSFLLGDPELRGLLVVGAFRSGELKPGDAFAAALDEMRRAAARCTELGLGPMDDEAVTALLAETLRAPLEEVAKLAAPCRQRTGGNPFFLRRFLLKLREDGRIAWDASAGRFRVSPEAVHESASTENVAALLAESLGRLPESTREALLAAACLGRSFRLDALAGLLERPPEAIAGALAPAFGAGLLVALDNGWDHVAHGAGLDAGAAFVHDRVSEAARSLGADERRQVLHRRAAERLLSGTGEADLPDRVFEIVGHLRRCRPLLRSPAELLRLAELDLLAARRARGSGAWSAMLEAAEEGLTALGEDGWSRPDRLCRDLHLEAAEAAALCGRADDMDRWTEAVLQHSADAVEATPAIILRVATWTGANRAGEALRASLAHLRKLGLRFPEPPPSSPALLWSIARFRWEIGQLRPDAVGRLPPMTDARALAATRLLMHSAAAVLVACPQLAALTIPAMLRLALRHGNAPESAFAWIGAAMLLAGVLGAPAAAADWERVALELTSDPRNARMRARVEFAASYASRPQHLPAREIRPLMLESWKLGLQGGDFEFAAYSGSGFIHLGLCAGADLEELEARAGEIADHLHRHRQQLVGARFASYHRAVLKLRHPSEDPCRLDGPGGSEEELLADYARRSDAGAEVYFWLSRLQLCCVFGRWGDAVAAALRMDGLMEGIRSTYIEAPAAFWTALALHAGTGAGARAGADVAGPAARAERTVRRYAHRVHEDHAHRLEMLRAEKARAAGRTQVAADAYDAALRLAAAAGNPAEEALAAERAASLQREAARSWVADAYLRTARFAWIRWGAGAKVEALDAEFPGLAAGRDGPGSASRGTLSPDGSARSRYRSSVATAGRDRSDGSSAARGGPDLDVETILRASEALGSALVLEDLVRRLMDLAIENAGAQRSVLLLPGEAGFTLEGDVDAEWGTARVREGLPLSRAAQRVPASIVQFVARSGEALVLDDPAAAGDFAQDAYLRSHAPRSVLCAPLRHRGTLSGILYLENRLAPGTFTPQRLALLTTLSGSMSVALENARLYARISDLNRAYERFVPRRFLALLDRRSIVDVLLGDQVEREMTVMFSDIRGFTTLSEKMNPRDTFAFINEFLGRMEPVVARHDGVIDKYIGDAIMALFPTGPDSALRASIAMLRALRDWNEERGQQGRDPVRIGIGLNSGHLMLGTVGTDTRMDGTVVSDAVNLASRVEDLTKEFGVPLLLTESTVSGLLDTLGYGLRPVDEVRVRGKQTATLVYECFDADPEPVRERKKTTADEFRRVWTAWRGGRAAEAMAGFDALLAALPGDSVVLRLRERCKAEAVAAAALPEA